MNKFFFYYGFWACKHFEIIIIYVHDFNIVFNLERNYFMTSSVMRKERSILLLRVVLTETQAVLHVMI